MLWESGIQYHHLEDDQHNIHVHINMLILWICMHEYHVYTCIQLYIHIYIYMYIYIHTLYIYIYTHICQHVSWCHTSDSYKKNPHRPSPFNNVGQAKAGWKTLEATAGISEFFFGEFTTPVDASVMFFCCCLFLFFRGYPLVICYGLLLKMTIEIVDFPIENGDFQ